MTTTQDQRPPLEPAARSVLDAYNELMGHLRAEEKTDTIDHPRFLRRMDALFYALDGLRAALGEAQT